MEEVNLFADTLINHWVEVKLEKGEFSNTFTLKANILYFQFASQSSQLHSGLNQQFYIWATGDCGNLLPTKAIARMFLVWQNKETHLTGHMIPTWSLSLWLGFGMVSLLSQSVAGLQRNNITSKNSRLGLQLLSLYVSVVTLWVLVTRKTAFLCLLPSSRLLHSWFSYQLYLKHPYSIIIDRNPLILPFTAISLYLTTSYNRNYINCCLDALSHPVKLLTGQ